MQSVDQQYYKKGFDNSISDSHSWRTVSNAVPYVIPYLKKTDRLLDVGSGPGTISKDFANYVHSVVGVEPTQELVDIANSQQDLPRSVTFEYGSAYQLPFDDNSFDVVHASQVILHLDDPNAALKEMLRVCKKGGYILIKDADIDSNIIYPDEYAVVLAEHKKGKFKNSSTSRIAGRELKSKAITAGYKIENIKMDGSVWFISSFEDRSKWCNIFCSRILAGKEVDYDENRKELDKIIKTYEDWRDDERSVMIFFHAELVYHNK